MKITYFGTAAAEAVPTPGCECAVCRHARKTGGRNTRLRTQALIDDRLLIDFPADAHYFSIRYGVNYLRIAGCLISHSHSDHLCAPDLVSFDHGFCATDREEPLHFFAGEDGFRHIRKTETDLSVGRRDVTLIEPFRPFTVAGYEITPLPANHAPTSSPLIFHIRSGEKSMVWAHDTGILPDAAAEALAALGRVDFFSLDCCLPFLSGIRQGHLSIDTCEETFANLTARGVIDGKTVCVLNHFSHNGGATQDDLESFCREKPYIPAYDGMTITF
ncbi:MAG: MBL fold metallo-hydrolase [Clostridia bacterium]|nr:MBL fold metallo-hydrolase [Clostridia bacterium]